MPRYLVVRQDVGGCSQIAALDVRANFSFGRRGAPVGGEGAGAGAGTASSRLVVVDSGSETDRPFSNLAFSGGHDWLVYFRRRRRSREGRYEFVTVDEGDIEEGDDGEAVEGGACRKQTM